jgi:hypothetical protein
MTNPNNKHIDPNIEMVGDDFVCPKENLGTSSDVAQTFSNDVTQILNEAQIHNETPTKPSIVWGGGDSQDGLEPDEYDNWHPHF